MDRELPPHIMLDRARKFASRLVKGNSDEGNLLTRTAQEAPASALPSLS
jgi:hypothetical protein